MNYSTRFLASPLTQPSAVCPSIGAAYSVLYQAEGEHNSGLITPIASPDPLTLTFSRVEDFVFDLYRQHRQSFALSRYQVGFSCDAAPSKLGLTTSFLSLPDLQEFLIASYARISLPIVYTMDIAQETWMYQFSLDRQEILEVT